MTAHSHGLNGHTHSFSVTSSKTQPTFTGTTSTTKNMNKNATGAFQNNIRGVNTVATKNTKNISNSVVENNGAYTNGCFSIGDRIDGNSINLYTPEHVNANSIPGSLRIDVSHQHSFTPSGTVESHAHSVSGTTKASIGDTSLTTSSGTFTGSDGTTDSSGSGTSFSIMPPYVVKYCWERTA